MKVRLKYVTNYSNKELVTKSSAVPDWWHFKIHGAMDFQKWRTVPFHSVILEYDPGIQDSVSFIYSVARL